MRKHVDDRRLFFGDVFGNTDGDLNIVTLFAGGPPCAWHRHESQTDQYFCVRGVVKVGWLDRQGNGGFTTLCRESPGPITIEPGLWHGYQVIGSDDAVIVQWNNRKWDGTDEERKSVEDLGVSWDRISR